MVDDAGVLNRVTKSDLKNMLSDLEYNKKNRINFVTIVPIESSKSNKIRVGNDLEQEI